MKMDGWSWNTIVSFLGLGLFSWGGLDCLPYCMWEDFFWGGPPACRGVCLVSGTDQTYGSNLMEYQFQGLLLESHMRLGIYDIPWRSGIFPVFVSRVSFVGTNRKNGRCQAFSKGLTFSHGGPRIQL